MFGYNFTSDPAAGVKQIECMWNIPLCSPLPTLTFKKFRPLTGFNGIFLTNNQCLKAFPLGGRSSDYKYIIEYPFM